MDFFWGGRIGKCSFQASQRRPILLASYQQAGLGIGQAWMVWSDLLHHFQGVQGQFQPALIVAASEQLGASNQRVGLKGIDILRPGNEAQPLLQAYRSPGVTS